MIKFFVRWLSFVVLFIIIQKNIPEVTFTDFPSILLTALILAVIHSIILPVLKLLTFPINFLSLGLFSFVLTILVIIFVDSNIQSFEIQGLVGEYRLKSLVLALFIGLALSVVNTIIGKYNFNKTTEKE